MARRRLLHHAMRLRSSAPMRATIADELGAARTAFRSGADGWRHLERAHILSQPWALDHVAVHAAMLHRAWRQRDSIELRGQLIRIIVAGPGSIVKRYPIGNTGRARVPATLPMPIVDNDVRAALSASGQPVTGASTSATTRHEG